jgi:hypothetical protein
MGPQGADGADLSLSDAATITLSNCGSSGTTVTVNNKVPFTSVAIPSSGGSISVISTGIINIPTTGMYLVAVRYSTTSSNCVMATTFNGVSYQYSVIDSNVYTTSVVFIHPVTTANTLVSLVPQSSGTSCVLKANRGTNNFCAMITFVRLG